jgi:hypothetical protein
MNAIEIRGPYTIGANGSDDSIMSTKMLKPRPLRCRSRAGRTLPINYVCNSLNFGTLTRELSIYRPIVVQVGIP